MMSNEWLKWIAFYLIAGITFVICFRVVMTCLKKWRVKNGFARKVMVSLGKDNDAHAPLSLKPKDLAFYTLILAIWALIPFILLIDEYKSRHTRRSYLELDEPGDGKTTLEEGCWGEHLKGLVNVKEEESKHFVHDPMNRVPNKPYGFLNDAWNVFLSKTQPGDTIRHFAIEPGEPYGKYGFKCDALKTGYAIVRDGIVIEQFMFDIDCTE